MAYLRKEPGIIPPKIQLLSRSERIIAGAYLSYAMQRGLLGRVLPSLRAVVTDISEEKETMQFYFYYDEEITGELRTLSKEAIAVAKKAFPETFHSTEEIVFFPFSKKMPTIGGDAVYARNEPACDD